MTTRSYGGYVMVDSHMDKHVPASRQYRSSDETDFIPKKNGSIVSSSQKRDSSIRSTESNTSKRLSNQSQREASADKYRRDVKAYIESNSGHTAQTIVHNNDLSKKRSSRSSESDPKAYSNTVPRRRSSTHYENGNINHSDGSSQRHSSRQYADITSGKTDVSQRGTSRHYDEDVADHSSTTRQRRSSGHYENSIPDHFSDSSRRRSSRHYEDTITDHPTDTHQRRSSRHYENSISDHSIYKTQRRHSRHHEDAYTDHSNDSSRSCSSKRREEDVTDRSHSSRRRSLNHYEDNACSRITDSSRKSPARHYEQYKEDGTDPATKYPSKDTYHTSDRLGYATLPSSTKLGKTERRDTRVHGANITGRAENHVGEGLRGKADVLSDSRADRGFGHHEYDNYSSLHRNGDDVQLYTRSLQRHSRHRDRTVPKSEQSHHSSHAVDHGERRDNNPDVRRNSSQFSAADSAKVGLHEQYVNYHLNKQTKINGNTNIRSDKTDARHAQKDSAHEQDIHLSYRSNNNEQSDDYKRRKPYKCRQTSVGRSSSQHFIEGDDTRDAYASNTDEYVTSKKRSSSVTRNENDQRETHNGNSDTSHNQHRSSFHSSKDKLERGKGDNLFTLNDTRNPGDASKSKQQNISEHKYSSATKHSHNNSYSRPKHNGMPNDVAGHGSTHSISKEAIDVDLIAERKRQYNSLFNGGQTRGSEQLVADSRDSNSLKNGSSRDYNHTNTEPTGRSRVADSSKRRSTTNNKHEEFNIPSNKQDISNIRRSSSSRSNDNASFASSSSSPRREDSHYKLTVDASPLTHTQDAYDRSREEPRHPKRSQTGISGHHNVPTAAKQQSSSAKSAAIHDEGHTDRSHAVESTEEYHNQELRGSRKDTIASHKLRSKVEREEDPQLDAVLPNSGFNGSIAVSPANSSASTINKNASSKSVSRVDLIEASSSTSTLKDNCITSKTSISDSISSLLGRNNKYQQFRSNQSEGPPTPSSISDKWRKLTRVILPDKDAVPDNGRERKAPAAIFYAAATRFMNTLSGVHNVLPTGAHISAEQPANDTAAACVPQNESGTSETQIEENTIPEAKPEPKLSPANTLSIQEITDKISPSHSIVSLEVPNVVASQRTSIISTPGNLSSHKMRISAYALMTEKTDAPDSELGNHVTPAAFDSEMKRRSKDVDTELTSFLPAEMSRREEKFHEAARVNDTDAIRALLKEKVNINCRNSLDRTALHWASANGNLEAVEVLLAHGADLEAKDKYGMRAVLWAAWFGHVSVLKALINAGANTRVTNKQGLGILHCAAENNHVAVISFIIEALENFDVSPRDKNERTPLHSAAEGGHVAAVTRLLEAKADVHKKDKAGATAVHVAVKCGHVEVLKALLLQGFEVEDRDVDGKTALHLAAEGGHKEAVDLLLDYTANPNSETVKEVTPLHLAAQEGHVEVCRSLVKYGLNVNAQNSQGNSALHIAANGNHKEVARILIDAKCELDLPNNRMQTPLHIAVESGHLDVVQVLLAGGASLDTREKSGKSALQLAARGNYVAVVDMLIKAERYYANAREYHDKDVGYVDPDTYLRNPQHPHAAQMKDVLWKLATKQLKPTDWKKLAYHWRFTPDHVKAIEQEYTGTTSYKEHSYRLLNIWLHGVRKDENVLKLLFEALVAIDRKHLAESVRRKVNLQADKPCSPSICTVS
ncbi:hypothetical protein BsWGS_04616 [Bradybaena similaris]